MNIGRRLVLRVGRIVEALSPKPIDPSRCVSVEFVPATGDPMPGGINPPLKRGTDHCSYCGVVVRENRHPAGAEYVDRVIREIFVADLGTSDWSFHWNYYSDGIDGIRLMVNCSDKFLWACADSEPVEPEDLDRLIELLTEYDVRQTAAIRAGNPLAKNINAELLFVTEKRQMRPMKWEHYSDEMRERMPYPERKDMG